jgi:hypothetical protein
MRKFDIVCIGAGIAAFGALAALADRKHKPSVLLLDGTAIDHPALRQSTLCPVDLRPGWSAQHFGLPAVRAFGDGGTSRLWHGGLFVPHPGDAVLPALAPSSDVAAPPRFDIEAGVDALCRSASMSVHDISTWLRVVKMLCGTQTSAANDLPDAWRSVLIPVVPPFLPAGRFAQTGASWLTQDRAMVVGLNRVAGVWQVRVARDDGFEVVQAEQILLCAGCLSSLALLSALAGQPQHGYADHLHVFVGVLAKPQLSPALRARLAVVRDQSQKYSLRRIWKTTVADDLGRQVDVSLSFRSVANPHFPRAGRRFGAFVGSRAASRWSKLALGLKNPLTAVEMLGYKYGHEFPFEHILIHATIAPRFPVGQVGAGHLTFEPDRDLLGRCGLKALDRFHAQSDLAAASLERFSLEDVASSLISGAQFCVGDVYSSLIADCLQGYGDSLKVCDTAGMAFTSIYNQGLLSLARGYGLASRMAC